ASGSTFTPVVRITEGNPYLMRLAIRRYLSTAVQLDALDKARAALPPVDDTVTHGEYALNLDSIAKTVGWRPNRTRSWTSPRPSRRAPPTGTPRRDTGRPTRSWP
ncbi:hypothetical protein AB0P45_29220, partial [Streptomyces niveus]|uniref:hypothetical protein n=1 Tax=Streptomyces niveus TaxID=193462 RepID=UPI00343A75C2